MDGRVLVWRATGHGSEGRNRGRPVVFRLQLAELAQLALDLRLDVERGLAVTLATVVAGQDEGAHLLAQLGIDRGNGGGQARELLVDIERRLAPAGPPYVAGFEHLANLPLAHGRRLRSAGRAGARQVVIHDQPALAVL